MGKPNLLNGAFPFSFVRRAKTGQARHCYLSGDQRNFLIIRYCYLRKLTSDEQRHVFSQSYIYTGAALSFIILLITAVSGLMLLFDFINSKF
ncbi:hypothetical protein [Pseudomonas viridiflava]|uniref:hypothetical protein n=1 Tax=Pseudomonas viridiflava TaxID=33069 RepID=UPI0013CEC7FF|nr:hypothetical protein [Pseudomonas viridiflava]MEE4222602.1 hypothetical protein [Pseudomonas viridiflava]